MRYPVLAPEKAPEVLEMVRQGDSVDEHAYEVRGQGSELDPQVIRDLARKLNNVREKYPDVLGSRDPAGGKFEGEACALVHQRLPSDFDMLADYDFWTWLAVMKLRELVDWRHGGKEGRAAIANFGIGKRDENLLYRMWLRADAGFDPKRSDPYELARRGDQDFWRSHVFRQDYGKCRALIRAFIRYQFPKGSGRRPKLKIPEIRELAKRLRRLHANLLFECLNEESGLKLIEREGEDAKSVVASIVE